LADELKLSSAELMQKMIEQKIIGDETFRAMQEKYHAERFVPRDRRGRGLLILGPTRRWAIEIASIVNIHPQESYVRVASYDDPGALYGLSPAGIIMAVPDQFVLRPEVSNHLIPMMHDIARYQR